MCLYQKASVPLAILGETLHLGMRWFSVFLFLITKLFKEIVSSLGPVQWILRYRLALYVFLYELHVIFFPLTPLKSSCSFCPLNL